MTIDLTSMSREELEELAKKVQVAMIDVAERERREALEALERTARDHGFELEELTGGMASGARAGAKAKGRGKNPPKYRNPENTKQTWTGRGRKPAWIKDAETAGTNISAFEI